MEGLKEYFISLFIVCFFCALSDMITDFASQGVAAAVKLISGLTVLLTVFSVFLGGCDIVNSVNNLKESVSAVQQSEILTEQYSVFTDNTKKELEINISSAIYEKFGIKPHNVCIQFSTEKREGFTDISVECLEIILPENTDEISAKAVKDFADRLLNTHSEISYMRSN